MVETIALIEAEAESMGKRLVRHLESLWSARIGNYRVLYTIEQSEVIVRAIRHRAVGSAVDKAKTDRHPASPRGSTEKG